MYPPITGPENFPTEKVTLLIDVAISFATNSLIPGSIFWISLLKAISNGIKIGAWPVPNKQNPIMSVYILLIQGIIGERKNAPKNEINIPNNHILYLFDEDFEKK